MAPNRSNGATGTESPPNRLRIIPIRAKPRIRINRQASLAGHYPLWLKGISLLAFTWAFLGWLNETWFYQFNNPLWLNRYTEYVIILLFGLWRIAGEKNPYTRRRLIILVANVTILWWLIPWMWPFVEPYMGYLGVLPAFPSLHTPGTLTFFLVLGAVWLFGRRVICGWGCPCVGIREVVGFPFRHASHVPRGPWAWRARHLKWLWFVMYLGAMWAMTRPPNNTTSSYLGLFGLMVALPYFVSMLLSPWIGNRGYCRFLCPYGATFGLLNKAGPFRIDFTDNTCIRCGLCIKVCDMGIPVWEMGAAHGQINTTECMGCGRCVTECPTESLAFHDAHNVLRPALRQDRAWLRNLADWNRLSTRWYSVAWVALLAIALTGAWYYSSQVGKNTELINSLGTLCGLPISSW